MGINIDPIEQHRLWQGKIEIVSRASVKNAEELSIAYTPGVAKPCLEIEKDYEQSFVLTRRNNLVAVITDGTAVLGLGDIGPAAAMPVMEGKCVLFKEFAGVDAFPICIDSKDTDTIVNTIALISKSFGGINLEDISAPRCFEIESRLKEICDIPVFHDDQHGTAIIASAAMLNACKVTGRDFSKARIVINGSGAAGTAIAKQLLRLGVGDVTMCDIDGVLDENNPKLDDAKIELTRSTNKAKITGNLADAMFGADAFIGVSAPNVVTVEMVKSMAKDSIVFAMANPTPEIMPDRALAAGAAVVGTGRSDFPNQINNVLAFPGIFKGALAVRAKDITDNMKIAAAKALSGFVQEDKLSREYILPTAFEPGVANCIAEAVAKCAREDGIARG
ncbi:MAG: NADP-dependent malic enzyme [Oscillospiraceae bacterium]|nr:NADP-dependent malic enzyme [Oscillospiraceae bacterium]